MWNNDTMVLGVFLWRLGMNAPQLHCIIYSKILGLFWKNCYEEYIKHFDT